MLLVAYRIDASLVTMSSGRNQKVKSQIENLFTPRGCDFGSSFCALLRRPQKMALMTLERWKRFLQMYLYTCMFNTILFFPPLAPMCALVGVSNLPLCRATRLSSTRIKSIVIIQIFFSFKLYHSLLSCYILMMLNPFFSSKNDTTSITFLARLQRKEQVGHYNYSDGALQSINILSCIQRG